MKLDQKQIHHICEKVLNELKSKGVIVFKSDEKAVLKRMIDEFEKNLRDEAAIDAEAKKMMQQYQAQIQGGEMNQSKLFMMIKKELAKKKGFIL
ncbi:MAG: DUF507 family protein [Pseudomonadota bacterium]